MVSVALFASVLPAFSNPYKMIAGEHPGFTRIVLLDAALLNPIITHEEKSIEISTSSTSSQLDIEGVYEKISDLRVRKIEAKGSAATITINCECDVYTSIDAARHVVIDIAQKDIVAPGQLIEKEVPTANTSETFRNRTFKASEFNTFNHAKFQAALSREISMNMGILDIEENEASPRKNPASKPPVGMIDQPDLGTMKFGRKMPGFSIRNSFDLENKKPSDTLSAEKQACSSFEGFSNFSDNYGDILSLDAVLTGGTDPDEDSTKDVERSVRLMYSAGLIEEASAILKSVSNNDPNISALKEIGTILNPLVPSRTTTLASDLFCRESVVLWLILAETETIWFSQPDYEGAVLEFRSYPPHLRRLLTPLLVERLQMANLPKLVDSVLATADFAFDEDLFELDILRLASYTKSGQKQKIADILNEISTKRSFQSPEEFIIISEAKLSMASRFTSADFSSLETFIFESTHEFEKSTFLQLKFRAALLDKNFQLAASALFPLLEIPTSKQDKYLADFFVSLTKSADDYTFAEFSTSAPRSLLVSLDAKDRQTFEKRMRELGVDPA